MGNGSRDLVDAGQDELRSRETRRSGRLMLMPMTWHAYRRGCQCGEAGCGDVPEANPVKTCDELPPGPVIDPEGCQCGEAGCRDVPQVNPAKACDDPLPGPVTDRLKAPRGITPIKSGSKPIQSGTSSVLTGVETTT